MKKILLTIVIGCMTVVSMVGNNSVVKAESYDYDAALKEAIENYKEYDMSANFAKALKNGSLPRAKGNIGTSKKNLKLKRDQRGIWIDKSVVTKNNFEDEYTFTNSKVSLIKRDYLYVISESSLKKRLGKNIKVYESDGSKYYFSTKFYKKGKYYIGVHRNTSYLNQYTIITVGTKKATMKQHNIFIK